jgi:beta-xylosidase
VYLQIHFRFAANESPETDEAEFFYSINGDEWTKIGEKLKMSYRLSHFTGYRFALFNYATQEIGGRVDFDWFRVISPQQPIYSLGRG